MTSNTWPPRFALSRERILRLLTGTRFYADPSAALREAILNAIDAVRRRQDAADTLDPLIDVTFDRDRRTLRVADNGIGMDRDSVTDFFSTVGASLAALEQDPQSVGEFGIGVVSYFMAGDRFELQTLNGASDPIRLMFHKRMLEEEDGKAVEMEAESASQGTSILIHVRNARTLELLIEKFPHWCRDVKGLSARILPGTTTLAQQGVSLGEGRHAIELQELPEWVEKAHLSPVSNPTGWEAMTGNSTVSVLYRGVFVQECQVEQLWGIQGTIDVNPKHFKPRLNREGFVGEEFQTEMTSFLTSCHPQILEAMVPYLRDALTHGALTKWQTKQWANLWLSVPRSEPYQAAVAAWDREFRMVPAFMLASPGTDWKAVSLDTIKSRGPKVFVAPPETKRPRDVVTAAVNYLRNTGETVIRGIRVDQSWLRYAPRTYATTADLIVHVFEKEFPQRVFLTQHANDILSSIAPVASLYTGPPTVDLVALGTSGQPIIRVLERLIINIDDPVGKTIVLEALRANRGPISLIESTAKYAHQSP